MPRYHFNVTDGDKSPDLEGEDLPDLAGAKLAGAKLLGEMLRDDAAVFWRDGGWRLDVTDATGLMLFSVVLSGIDHPTPFPSSVREGGAG